jgi:hypothetical protein
MQATLNPLRKRCLTRLAQVTGALLLGLVALLGPRSSPMAAPEDWHTARAVLVMVQDPGCPYCARWEAEVGRSYRLSEEGKFAPLVPYLRGAPEIAGIAKIVYSPTFVMFAYGHEVGRIVGYQGSTLFWMQLEPLIAKAGFVPAEPVR